MAVRKCSYCKNEFPEENLEDLEDEIVFCSEKCFELYYDALGDN